MIGGLFLILLTLLDMLDMTYSWIYYYTLQMLFTVVIVGPKLSIGVYKMHTDSNWLRCLFGSWLYGTIDQKNMKNLIGRKECKGHLGIRRQIYNHNHSSGYVPAGIFHCLLVVWKCGSCGREIWNVIVARFHDFPSQSWMLTLEKYKNCWMMFFGSLQ